MRHVRDVIRLRSAGMSTREIARRVGTAPSTVRLTIHRFEAAGLSWPLSDDITDTELEARLFASAGAGLGTRRGHRRQAEPDWAAVHRELRRKHVTLAILWEEYIAGEPGGYRYSRFCELYRAWEGRLSVTMRQSHAAGDKLFVDYAGDGVPVMIDRRTGERRAAQIFVAVLGASSFTYAQATWTQGLADWIGGHVGAFEAIGGVPALLVPDNTKVAVIKACLYDPRINRSYADMAAHYGTAILPARPRRPRDKTSVSYCTLFWRLRGDGDEPGRAGVAPSAAFEYGLLCGQRPQATIQMVTTAFCDQPLTAPLVHGGFRDAKPGSDLACSEHATAA